MQNRRKSLDVKYNQDQLVHPKIFPRSAISSTIPLFLSHDSFTSTWQVNFKTLTLKLLTSSFGLCATLQLFVKQLSRVKIVLYYISTNVIEANS